MGTARWEMKKSLEHVIETPQTTLDNERIHGYGSVVKKEHPWYHLLQFLTKLYLACTRNLVLPPVDHTQIRLLSEIEIVARRRPNRVNAKGMYLGDRARDGLRNSGGVTRRRRRATVKSIVKYHGEGWRALGFAMKNYYAKLAMKRRAENHKAKQEDLAHCESALQLHLDREASMGEFYRHTLRSQEFRLSDDDHANLQLKWTSKRMGHEQVKLKEAEICTPVGMLPEQLFQEMLKIRQDHLGPEAVDRRTYEWVHEICRRYLWFEGTVICVTMDDTSETFYYLRTIGKGTHELVVQPLDRHVSTALGARGVVYFRSSSVRLIRNTFNGSELL